MHLLYISLCPKRYINDDAPQFLHFLLTLLRCASEKMAKVCQFCNKNFKNSRSLATHRYIYHKKHDVDTLVHGEYNNASVQSEKQRNFRLTSASEDAPSVKIRHDATHSASYSDNDVEKLQSIQHQKELNTKIYHKKKQADTIFDKHLANERKYVRSSLYGSEDDALADRVKALDSYMTKSYAMKRNHTDSVATSEDDTDYETKQSNKKIKKKHSTTFNTSSDSVDADEQAKKPKFSMKIVKELHRSLYLYEQIGVASTITRRAILRNVPTIFYRNLKYLCLGLRHGQIEFSDYYKHKLQPHDKLVHGISKTSDSKLKDHIIKHANRVGAFLKRVLPIITPRLVALI